jgi:hypothetical protein
MDCPTCKTAYTHEHFQCIETFVDYPENNVVSDILARRPDVFQFLLTVIQSQVANPTRFRPVPTWFATQPTAQVASDDINAMADVRTEELMDMARFRHAIGMIDTTRWRDLECETDKALMQRLGTMDAYMLARFIVLFCPLQLEGINKSISDASDVPSRRAAAQWQQYKVTWSDEVEQQWERAGGAQTPEYLYHGSPLTNWASILRNGLKVTSKTKWMTTGAAYGDGIYCSDTLNVSWSYSHGGLSTGADGTAPIVIGVYEVWGAAQHRKAPGYFVVPREDQLLLRYLIYMPDSRLTNVAALDQSLRTEWLSKGSRKAEATRKKNTKVEARLRKEVAAIQAAGIRVSDWDTVQVRCWIEDQNVDIAIPHQFPFSAPALIVNDQRTLVRDWTPKSTLLEALRALP